MRGSNLANAMGEDHDDAWLGDHVLLHVLVLAGHHHHHLQVGKLANDIVFKERAVELADLEAGQACGPIVLVGVAYELVQDAQRTAETNERRPDAFLVRLIGRADQTAPAKHSRPRQ